MVNKDKKFIINEGRAITNGKFAYGGFPRILSEENNSATDRFQDSPNQGQVNVATKPNDEEDLYVPKGMGLRYPSAEYKRLDLEYNDAADEVEALKKALSQASHAAYLKHMQGLDGSDAPAYKARAATFQHTPDPEMLKKAEAATARAAELRKQVEAHPHHKTFMDSAEKHSKLVRGGNYGE